MDHGLSEELREETQRRLERELRAAGVREPSVMAAEAAAVVDALTAAAAPGATSVDRNEALALASLLGRRMSATGAAIGSALLLLEGVERARGAPGKIDAVTLRGAVLEGFVQGFREVVESGVERRIVEQSDLVALGPGLFLAVIPSVSDPDLMSAAMDALGRTLLKRDAKACAIWVPGRLGDNDEGIVAGLTGLVENVRMIGARVAIAVPDPESRRILAERLDKAVAPLPDLEAALEALGFGVKETNVLRRWLGR